MEFENVVVVNFPELDEIDVAIVQKNFESFFSKISFLNNVNLHLAHKEYAKGGIRKQHEIHAKLTTDRTTFFASETDWQFLEVLQNALKKLEKEVQKKHSNK